MPSLLIDYRLYDIEYLHLTNSHALLYVTCYGKPTRVLGMDRRRFYCRVQLSKSQTLKFSKPGYGQKLYKSHMCLSSQFFEKRSILYVHSSTLNVSIYAPYYATLFASQ